MKISRGLQKKTYCKFHHESVHDAAHHCDEIKCIPGVFKVALGERKYIKGLIKRFINQRESRFATIVLQTC
jgi:hypothetical protein